MSAYLFDTNVFSLIFSDKLPEKWARPWKGVRLGTKKLLLFESLISEIFYKNAPKPKHGFQVMRDKLIKAKSFKGSEVIRVTDEEAFLAGEYVVTLKHFNLSLVDAFILAIAKKYGAEIFTTDSGLKQAAKSIELRVNYVPFKQLS